MSRRARSESGSILIMLAVFLMVLLGFAAFGTEAGRWFLVRAELSKTVDAGALAGAKNLSNPHVDPRALAQEFCAENFHSGYLGTPTTGSGSVSFNIKVQGDRRIQVDGRTNAPPIMSRLFGVDDVPVATSGAAQMRPVEIMLVLDRSGSMSGQAMTDLKIAARSFLDFFVDSQNRDRIGLVSFASSARVERALGNMFVAPLKTAINAMAASGYTNPEDAIDQADGPQGFTNQTGLLPDDRLQQFLIFFSDGRPNSFRGFFESNGTTYDAIANCVTNCDPGDFHTMHPRLGRTDAEARLVVLSKPTGDGVLPSQCGAAIVTTRWLVLDDYPVPGYAPDDCDIPDPELATHVCTLASTFAVQHAREHKNAGVTVFAIGLGARINNQFLQQIASSPEQVYIAPTSDQLQALFQRVAQEIKLRLVL